MRFALLFVAAMTSLAHAQAPGEVGGAPAPGSPGPYQQPGQVPAQSPGVMARPWSVALGLGGESLSPNGGQAIGLGVLELAGHYRFRPALELGLTLDGGGGRSGTISTGGLYVDFRYHVHPEQPWNVIFQGSLGVGTACGKDASDLECKGRPSARVGVGLERRLGMWALEGDLRVLTVRDNKEVPDPVSETTPYLVARYALVGVVLSFGASLYF